MRISTPNWMPGWITNGPVPYWIISGVVGGAIGLLLIILLWFGFHGLASAGSKYEPPSFEEFEAVAGPESTPLENFRLYDLMRRAMEHRVYDRQEAFERLEGIAEGKRQLVEMEQRVAALRQAHQ